jgi:hypothetical protein
LKENCALNRRSAETYMQLARHRGAIEAEMARTGHHLSLRAARTLIARSKPAKPAPAEPAFPAPKREKDLVEVFAEAWEAMSNEQRTAGLEQIDVDEFLHDMPPAWISKLQEKALGPLDGSVAAFRAANQICKSRGVQKIAADAGLRIGALRVSFSRIDSAHDALATTSD